MQSAFIISIFLHTIIALLMIFGLTNPFYQKDSHKDIPIMVEFAVVDKETKAPVLSPNQTIEKQPIKEDLTKEILPKQPPLPPKPEPIVEEVEQRAAKEEIKKSEVQSEKPKLEPAKEKKVEDAKSLDQTKKIQKENKEKEQSKTEKQILKKEELKKNQTANKNVKGEKKAIVNVNNKDKKTTEGKKKDQVKKETLDDLLTPQKTTDSQQNSKSTQSVNAQKEGPAFTVSEIAKLKAHISKCWNVHAGAKDAKEHVVDVDIHFSPEGFVEKAEIVDKKRMLQDPFYRVAAETAQRSLLDPDCNPFPIPKSDYKRWADITFRFDPKDMF